MASTGRWRRGRALGEGVSYWILTLWAPPPRPPALWPPPLEVANGHWELSLWLINCTWAPDTNWGNVNSVVVRCGSHFHVWRATAFLRRGREGGGAREYPHFETERDREHGTHASLNLMNLILQHTSATGTRGSIPSKLYMIWSEPAWLRVICCFDTRTRGYWPLINIRSLLMTFFTIMLTDSLRDIQRTTDNWNTSRVSDN